MRVISVPVRHVDRATPRTRIINLDVSRSTLDFTAGQAVMLGLHGSPLRKPYSIASAPWEVAKSGVMQALVQVDDTGGPDPHLEFAAPGTLIDVEGPFGSFGLPPQVEPPLVFIAGGTGIAPLRSMLMEYLERSTSQPAVLIYSARAIEEFAFRVDLSALEAAGRLKSYLTITRDEREWQGRRGRISEELLREALPSTSAMCFVCGPPAMVNDARALLAKLGVGADRILVEDY